MQKYDNFLRLIMGGSQAGVFYMYTETQRHRVLFRTQNLQNYLTKNEGRKTKDERRFDLTVHRDSETQSFYFEH